MLKLPGRVCYLLAEIQDDACKLFTRFKKKMKTNATKLHFEKMIVEKRLKKDSMIVYAEVDDTMLQCCEWLLRCSQGLFGVLLGCFWLLTDGRLLVKILQPEITNLMV